MHSQLDCAGVTDVGRTRTKNQDHFLIADLKKSMLVGATSLPLSQQSRLYGGTMGRLLMVADGMGGHAAGERASTLAIDCMVERLLNSMHWCFGLDRSPDDDFIGDLKELLKSAHQRIVNEGLLHSDQRGMGTTLTMAYVIWPRMYVVHAGDSRCYLFRNGVGERLTIDHTLARQLVDSGGLKAEEEATSRWSNVLWNVLGGGNGEVTAEVRRVDLQPGDAVLLCSDGLYRYLDDDDLMRMMTSGDSAQSICQDFIKAANERGGSDNITAVVALFGDEKPSQMTTVATEVPIEQILAGSTPEEDNDGDSFTGLDTLPG